MNKEKVYDLIVQDKDFTDYIKSEECKAPDNIDTSGSYIIFSETPGNGKTWSALEIAKAYVDKNWDKFIWKSEFGTTEVKQHLLPNFVGFNKIVNAANDMTSFNGDAKAKALTFLYELQECPFLIIDDLWVEKQTQLKDTQLINYLYEIMDYRYNNRKDGLQTIITTNVNPDTLSSFYNQRTASRILGTCKIINKGGADKRVENMQGN